MVMPLPSTPPEARIPIKNYRAWVNELRRLGGKDANAALRGADRRQTTGGRRANWPYVNGMKRDPWLRTPP